MPVTVFRPSIVTALVVAATACASSGAAPSSGAASSASAPSTARAASSPGTTSTASAKPASRDVITESELPTSGSETAYDAILRLRPDFLHVRPAQSYSLQPDGGASGPAPAPALIVNGQRVGELSDLRHIPATTLKSVRYYTIEQAKRKFGMQYAGGAFEIAYR